MSQADCVECGKALQSDEARIEAADDGRILCTDCYDGLAAFAAEYGDVSSPVAWPTAVLGGVAGGVAGVAIWAVLGKYLGNLHPLLALAIGLGVGQGALAGNQRRRSRALQVAAAVIAAGAFLGGQRFAPTGITDQFMLGLLGLVVAYEAWVIPKPG